MTVRHSRIKYLALIRGSDTSDADFFDRLVDLFVRPQYFSLVKLI